MAATLWPGDRGRHLSPALCAPGGRMKGFKKTNGLAAPPIIAPTPMTVSTPFLDARDEWDRRDGMKVRRVKRLESSLVLAWVAIVLLIGYAIMAPGKTRYLPYVVEVAQSGQI